MKTHGADELRFFAAQCVASLAPRGNGATVLALSGELGAGKTTFTQGVARALGITETVSSPTFVIEKRYPLPLLAGAKSGKGWRDLIHIDAYRLHSEQELEMLGWQELLADPGNLIVLEWPERVPGLIPETAIRMRFDIEGEGRIITIDGKESGGKNSQEEDGAQER